MMMLYADFKKTWPFMLIEILSDFPTSKLWKNLSFKSFSNFSFVVDEVLADELQREPLKHISLYSESLNEAIRPRDN